MEELTVRNSNEIQPELTSRVSFSTVDGWTEELRSDVKAQKNMDAESMIAPVSEEHSLSQEEKLLRSWKTYLDASAKTTLTYTKNVKPCLKYLMEKGITRPTKADIVEYRDWLNATGHKPTTIQAYITAIKMFFSWTEEAGIYPNITKGKLKGAKIDNEHKKDYLTSSQANKLLSVIDRDTLKGKRDYAMILLMLTTGLREISIIRADIKDIKTTGGNRVIYHQGKGHEEKDAIYKKITQPVEDAIEEYLDARGLTLDSDGALFASTAHRNQGERLTTKTVSVTVKEYLKQAGMNSERLTAHSLRHTAATLSLLNGATLEETKQLLDHTNINTTMIYSHALDRAKSKNEQLITDAIFMQKGA